MLAQNRPGSGVARGGMLVKWFTGTMGWAYVSLCSQNLLTQERSKAGFTFARAGRKRSSSSSEPS